MKKTILAVAALLLAPVPSQAHHSGAMFDHDTSRTLTGTVRVFQYTNPHCYIQLMVDRDGQTEEWSIEMAAPSHLQRLGWRRSTLRPGDRITVTFSPLRNGDHGGEVVEVTKADGSPLELAH